MQRSCCRSAGLAPASRVPFSFFLRVALLPALPSRPEHHPAPAAPAAPQVPLGAGLALAHQYKGDGGVAVAMYGDGAANQVGETRVLVVGWTPHWMLHRWRAAGRRGLS